ncbi:MAG TPA: LPS export ABC transporter periplasmic protein LptC [Myxococcota bacterium]|nr:LPS export ABC transporter periplasmic protein LptC [Myxococcota bacterium]
MAAVVCLSLGCGPASDFLDNGGPRAAPEMPPIEMDRVIYEGYHGDLQDLLVTAAGATVDMATKVAHLRDVSIHFATEDASKVEIAAPHGQFHLDKDDFVLTDGVTGTTEEGQKFKTRAVHYVGARRVIASDSPVELRRDNLVLTATGMELEVATHKLHLTGNVKARVTPKAQPQ